MLQQCPVCVCVWTVASDTVEDFHCEEFISLFAVKVVCGCMCCPEVAVGVYILYVMLLYLCCRQWWPTSSQIHLCAAALWVAVNSTLIYSSRRVHRATVGRVCPRSPYYYPAYMRGGERMAHIDGSLHPLNTNLCNWNLLIKKLNLLPAEKVRAQKETAFHTEYFVLHLLGYRWVLATLQKVLQKY